MCQPPITNATNSVSSDAHHLFLQNPSSSDETPFLRRKPPQPSPPAPPTARPLPLYFKEAKSILSLSLPLILTGLLLYSRSMISMLFLGRLGPLPLAGGSLAIGFGNITGYSVLSGLATGMEPICGQAHGAGRHSLLGAALKRTILLLLSASIPISFLWLSMRRILLLCRQNPDIAAAAHSFIVFSIPDLLFQSFLHPLRIFFRTQSITFPLTATAAATAVLHFPINHLLVSHFRLGIPGVALASVSTNATLVLLLLIYLHFSGVNRRTGGLASSAGDDDTFSFHGWRNLLALAVPSCVSVCLEWWWYEIMVLLCGLLQRPESTVAAMGVLIQTTSLIYIFPSSLSSSVSTRVGNELGANRPDRARRAAAVGIAGGGLLGLTAFSFSVSVRHLWAEIFTGDSEIVRLTAAVLPVLGLCELGNCPQTAGAGILRGSARPRAAANVNLGSFYGVGMPVAVCLAFWAGLDFMGLWVGLLAAQVSCLGLMLLVVLRTDWDRQAGRAQRLTGGACRREDDDVDCKPIDITVDQ
ncbi:MATE efflux family protein 9 [Apostasia shenzhenica]|uniref:Protein DETOXIFICATION n=1 Tax=Apostasia shenzhenica TaxID=1088818 RepID=A0A2H9ZWR3_9ASPA|nr:MATE efflux family protein 9 [Apostasia shenzhenica]